MLDRAARESPPMEASTLYSLLATAAFIGFFHTLTGPDHYVPFIAMSRIGNWSLARTLFVATACGLGHVLSSVVLGFAGIALSIAVSRLEWVEGIRGDLAAWALLTFGLLYMIWGVRRAILNRPHRHVHLHGDGTLHAHEHEHHADHAHPHPDAAVPAQRVSMTPWVLFTIFVLGPCEPLIPILMFPALRKFDISAVWLVAAVFSIATLGTMLAMTALGYVGLLQLRGLRLERYAHAIAGGSLALCGLLMVVGF
jgi:ABC-type nickel/cobalt efflux system permease component RcnA